MGTLQTKEELWAMLQEHMEFLHRSCESFDSGYISEAKRLAVTARVLMHDTKQSRSLLRQLKLLPGMGFFCTARPQSENTIFGDDTRLVLVEMGGKGVSYKVPADKIPPPPGQRHKIRLFPEWWNEPIIITKGFSFCRRDIVLNLSNKVGGAHVDPELDAAFAELLRDNPLGLTGAVGDDEPRKVPDIELHSMRQIAYEIIKSIERKLARG